MKKLIILLGLILTIGLSGQGWAASLKAEYGDNLMKAPFVVRYKFHKDSGVEWRESTYQQREAFLQRWRESEAVARQKDQEYKNAMREKERALQEKKRILAEKENSKKRKYTDLERQYSQQEREDKQKFKEEVREQQEKIKDMRSNEKKSNQSPGSNF